MSVFKAFYLRQRFFPSWISVIINPFFFTRRSLLKQMNFFAKELHGKLLDFGCGSKPYRELFTGVDEYIGTDMENEGHNHENEDIDVYYDGKNLPFESNLFDAILCSEVLEHVPDLNHSLSELNRILRVNGKILITTPFVWPEHEMPYDYRRFTSNGLKQVLEDNGFLILNQRKSGSYVESVTQMWMMYLHSNLYTNNKYINLMINALFIFPFSLLGLILSKVLPAGNGLYLNVVILAEKR